jgi:hypothetical protein
MAELSQHPDVVDLAEYAEGLLDDPRRAAVEQHVRGCPDCTATLADLAGLPQTLATAPLPPLPADVAQRLDQAIAAESASRASGWSGTAQVTPLRPKRRWLAPVAAAAAVIGAVAIAVPVVNSGSDTGTDDAGSEVQSSREADADDGGAFEEDDKGAAQPGPADQAPVIPLTSESFGRDVIDGFYGGSSDLRSRNYSTSRALRRRCLGLRPERAGRRRHVRRRAGPTAAAGGRTVRRRDRVPLRGRRPDDPGRDHPAAALLSRPGPSDPTVRSSRAATPPWSVPTRQ